MTVRPALLLAALLMACVLLSAASCGRRSDTQPGRVHIPVQETARDQFQVARQQQRNAEGVFEDRLRERELRVAIMAYQRVVDLFPNDEEWTPLAALLIGDLQRQIGENQDAIAQYQRVLEAYPEDIPARFTALFGMGRALDDLRRPQEAELYYRMLIEESSLTGIDDEAIREMVAIARRRVRTIQVLD